ncbi:MAG: YiiG family protein [Acetatifactor sp.]|nr:YiiG family protein [Acetatifactor sp.]
MKKASCLAIVCAVAMGMSGCGMGDQGGGAVDGNPDRESYTREESTQPRESSDDGAANVDSSVEESTVELNEFGLDEETMKVLKYNVYVELNNTIVQILNNLDNYFLVVDTAEEFCFREDAEYSYGYQIKGFNMDAVEDAELVYNMAPAYETLDGLVADMLPSMREIMETFNAIDDSEYTYEQNEYHQPKENHARLMACLDEFIAYAYDYLDQVNIIADETVAAREAKLLEEGRLIIYYYNRMLTLSSEILDEIYDQGIDDYNLTELDLTPIYPLFEKMQETEAAYDEAVSDNNQLTMESLSSRQVSVDDWNSLIQAFEWMIKQVESGVPDEDSSGEYLGGLKHIYVVLSDKVYRYNSIFSN